MTWGLEWGFTWGGEPEAYDFKRLFDSHRWKQLDDATEYRKLMNLFGDILASWDAEIVLQAGRVGIAPANGDELDDWGAMVGIVRNGMADPLYRRAIKAKCRANLGQGDPQTIYDIVRIFSDGNAKCTIVEAFPANFIVWLHNLTLAEQKQVAALFDGVPGLGIGANVVIVDPDGVFQWAGPNTPTVTRHWSGNNSPSSEHAGFAGGVII